MLRYCSDEKRREVTDGANPSPVKEQTAHEFREGFTAHVKFRNDLVQL